MSKRAWVGFNPLAGIRCIQTHIWMLLTKWPDRVSIPWRGFVACRPRITVLHVDDDSEFQSPGGDSLHSDIGIRCLNVLIYISFNPLCF